LVFSPNSEILAFSANINNAAYIFAGKEKAGPFLCAYYLTFSPNSKMLSYSVVINEKWFIYLGKDKIAGPFNTGAQSLTFSPDGLNLAYFNGLYFYINENLKAGPFYNLYRGIVTFSSDNNTVSYDVSVYNSEIKGNERCTKILMNDKEYTGSIFKNYVVYIDNDVITIK
jgi:hypothetical protein